MLRYCTSVILIALTVVLGAALDLLIHVVPENGEVKTWIEHQALYSPWALLLALAGLIATIIAVEVWQHQKAERSGKQTIGFSAPLNPALRLGLLDNIKKLRVDPRLRQGLRMALRVDLGLTEIPNAVHPNLRVYDISEGEPLTDRPMDKTIQDIFQNIGLGQILILGEPGTGRTNLLLELADSLINEARYNQVFPIPAVFNLSRWTLGKDDRTFSEWLKGDLVSEYGLSPATARTNRCYAGLVG